MDKELASFLLQQIGFPVVAAIIHARSQKGQPITITSQEVVTEFFGRVTYWTTQGTEWLKNNPEE